jgi:hypothetical protein
VTDRYAYCLFCDDVRQEVGNKFSYMGVYPSELTFGGELPESAPAVLPKIVAAVWLVCAVDDPPKKVRISIFAPPGRSKIFEHDLDPASLNMPENLPELTTKISVGGQIPFFNLAFVCSGIFEVAIETEKETLTAGRLRINFPGRPDTGFAGPSPTASPPPSEQSPRAVPETKPQRAPSRRKGRRSAQTPEPE